MKKQALLTTGNPAWKYRLLLGIVLLAHAPSTAQAQQLVAGAMIRVRASQSTGTERGWTEGSVDRLTPDTLWYQSGGSVSAMSWDNVELERSTFRNHGLSGLGIGAVAGGAIGALVANVIFEQTYGRRACHSSFRDLFGPCDVTGAGTLVASNSRGKDTVLGAAGGALIGGPLGYFVGRVLGRWETVKLDQLTVGAGSLSLSLRVRR